MAATKSKEAKYYDNRSRIQDGDLFFTRGSRFISKAIRALDSSYYNHVGVLMVHKVRILAIDMNDFGIELDLFSGRVKDCTDFTVLRPLFSTPNREKMAIQYAWDRLGERVGYDYGLAARWVIRKAIGLDLRKLGSAKRDICSEFVKDYLDKGGLINKDQREDEWFIDPQDIYDSNINFRIIIP